MVGTVRSDDGYEASAFMAQAWTQSGDWGTSSGLNTYDTQLWSQGHVHNNYPAYNTMSAAHSSTDSDMRSSMGYLDYNEQDLQGLSPAGPDEHLF